MWRDEAYLLDILQAARQAQEFTRGVAYERFAKDALLQNAVMHVIQIIGEAANCISPDFKSAHPEIPWRTMAAMRHRLVHEYFRIIPERVWDVVEKDIPALIPLIEPLVPPDET